MPGGLKQISMQYVKTEDRILLRVSTRDRKEYRFWLTRAMVLNGVWPAMERLLLSNPDLHRLGDEDSRKAVLSFEHENLVDKKAFGTSFDDEDLERPLGDDPVVVTGLKANALENRIYNVEFRLKGGREARLRFDAGLVHNFCKLLSNTVDRAAWDASIGFDPAAGPESAERRIH